ncbi:MAG: tyrosine-protein phosphatase [Eubacteriaceae bacterium]|nr:tyrosine-protein phosphatase [Eubacteriaceae bacterium]
MSDEAWNAMKMFFIADESYFEALCDEAEKQFGGLEGYISRGLGITDAERERMRELYLD